MFFVRVFVSCIFALTLAKASFAANMPGREFGYLQRIQGDWQRHCYASKDGNTKIYRRDFLVVDFTHMRFLSKIYLDGECSQERTHFEARFKFVFAGGYRSVNGLTIYPFNITSDEPDARFFQLAALNISALDGSRLFFGRDFSGESDRGERLSELDSRNPFLRHY